MKRVRNDQQNSSTNKRHRYVKLNDQLSKINIKNILIKSLNELDYVDDQDPNPFHNRLLQLVEQNLHSGFQSFFKLIKDKCTTLEQLLHYKSFIIEQILHHFDIKFGDDPWRTWIGLLDLIPALARSLSSSLYPHLNQLLPTLLSLPTTEIAHQSPPLLEKSYVVLASLLSQLSRDLLKNDANDALNLFDILIPYINNTSDHAVWIAQAWSAFVRRSKSNAFNSLATHMILSASNSNSPQLEECVAISFSEAIKSPNLTLHSRTHHIFSVIVNVAIQNPQLQSPLNIGLKILISAIHHIRDPHVLQPISDIIQSNLLTQVQNFIKDSNNHDQLSISLRFSQVLLGVRKGVRVDDDSRKNIFKHLHLLFSNKDSIPRSQTFIQTLQLLATALVVGKLEDLLGSGIAIIEKVFQHPDHDCVLGFCMALSELNWSGFEQFILPQLSKAKYETNEQLQSSLFTLLATLAERNQLPKSSTVTSQRFQSFFKSANTQLGKNIHSIVKRIKNDDIVDDDISLLSNVSVLVLADVGIQAKGFEHDIKDLFEYLVKHNNNKNLYSSTPLNDVYMTSIVISIMSTLGKGDILRENVNDIIVRYSNYSTIVKSLSQLCQSGKTPKISNVGIELLKKNILSISSELRKSSLILLSLLSESENDDDDNIYSKCVNVENVPLTIQSSRDRNLSLRRVGQILLSINSSNESRKIGLMFMLSQFKVNFRPIYDQASDSIAEILEAHPDELWSIIFPEIEQAATGSRSSSSNTCVPDWMVNENIYETKSIGDIKGSDYETNEPLFRCTNLNKWDKCLSDAFNDVSKPIRRAVETQTSIDRFDINNYEEQLLSTLTKCVNVAEKNTRTLTPLFLQFAKPNIDDLNDEDERQTLRTIRYRLSNWLKLFSEFNNPKAQYKADEMWNLHLDILSKGEGSLQNQALECILTWKNVSINTYEESLKNILNESNFRDELINFSLDIESNVVSPNHRQELIPIVIRMLYGIMIWRKGRSSSSQGASTRRVAVLTALSGCLSGELSVLIELMTKQLQSAVPEIKTNKVVLKDLDEPPVGKRQLGFLTLMKDLLKYLGKNLVDYWPILLGLTIELIHDSNRRINIIKESNMDIDHDNDGDVDNKLEDNATQHTPLRNVRLLGLKRFGDFFKQPVDNFEITPYVEAAFKSFISPRIPFLSIENTQSPSSLLELFAIWSENLSYIKFLNKFDQSLLPCTFSIITAQNVKPSVILRVFDIVDHIIQSSTEDAYICDQVLKPNVHSLLENLSQRFTKVSGGSIAKDEISKREISILSEISKYVQDSNQAGKVLELLSPLLRQPNKLINERVKCNLLIIYSNLLNLVPDFKNPKSDFFLKNYNTFATLFSFLKSRQAREELVKVFNLFKNSDKSLEDVCSLIEDLNSYSVRRIDEPDFDRRLEAFAKIDSTCNNLNVNQWIPVLHNMLFFVQDYEELALRSSSSSVMRKFVKIVSDRCVSSDDDYGQCLLRMLYPGLRNGLRSKYELVRVEILTVISTAVENCHQLPTFNNMKCLLMEGDSEANFFNNIHHVQIHRRSRALNRFSDLCDKGALPNDALVRVFIPVIGHFISGSTDKRDHNLTTDAIKALGHASGRLGWSAYNGLVRQYLKLAKAKDASEKVYIRATISVLEFFHFSMTDEVKENKDEEEQEDHDDDDDDDENDESKNNSKEIVSQGASSANVADAVTNRLLPLLLKYLEEKDETEASIRIPIAAGYVRVALFLPVQQREIEVNRLITVLAQVFKSKDNDTRVLARETLCKIASIAGPDYLPSIISALREALTRGAQLHVLTFTVHSVIIHLLESESGKYDNLDLVSSDIVAVIAETTFGRSAKDASNEEWRTQTREVKSAKNKSLDMFQILSKYCSPSKIPVILLPVRDIITQTESTKMIAVVDEVLRRTTLGVNSNKQFEPSDILSLCYSLISQNSKFLQPSKSNNKKRQNVKEGAIVQLKRDVQEEKDYFSSNSHKFINLGLDLFNTSFKRSTFDFKNDDHLARIDPLVSSIGNTLYSTNTDTVILGLKAASSITKAPLPSLEKTLPVFVKKMFALLDDCGGTQSELSQTILRSLAVLLRDVKDVTIKEEQLKHLLALIKPDLEEHDRQNTLFTLLRAIINRKLIVPEIYEMMERVAEIMVTNQSEKVRETCRNIQLQFLLDYPQGKNRLRKQMTFLAQNLSYVHESGRLSVMEFLSALFIRFSPDILREHGDVLFLSLIMVLANDDSAKCKEISTTLIKLLISTYDKVNRDKVVSIVHSWSQQNNQSQLLRLSAQVIGIFVDGIESESKMYLSTLLDDLLNLVQFDNEWQVIYHALNSINKVISIFPQSINDIKWLNVKNRLMYPHVWVRFQASKLINTLFGSQPNGPFLPKLIKGKKIKDDQYLLSLEGLIDLSRFFCNELKSEHLDNDIAHQIVKNLIFISRCFALVDVQLKKGIEDENDETIVEKVIEDEDKEDDEENDDDDDENNLSSYRDPLGWLFRKLSYQCRLSFFKRTFEDNMNEKKMWIMQPTFILHWMGYMVNILESDRLKSVIYQLLHPIIRIQSDANVKQDKELEELKGLAQQVQVMIQDKVDNMTFTKVYQAIRSRANAVKEQRKTARKQNLVKNPQLAAHQKNKRSAAKMANKKRKDKHFSQMKRTLA